MSLHASTADAVNAAPAPAISLGDADHDTNASPSDADGRDAPASDNRSAFQDRPMVAARGILIGIVISIPLWALLVLAAYLLI